MECNIFASPLHSQQKAYLWDDRRMCHIIFHRVAVCLVLKCVFFCRLFITISLLRARPLLPEGVPGPLTRTPLASHRNLVEGVSDPCIHVIRFSPFKISSNYHYPELEVEHRTELRVRSPSPFLSLCGRTVNDTTHWRRRSILPSPSSDSPPSRRPPPSPPPQVPAAGLRLRAGGFQRPYRGRLRLRTGTPPDPTRP